MSAAVLGARAPTDGVLVSVASPERVVRACASVGLDRACLTPEERGRMLRLVRQEDRSTYLAAHLLARFVTGLRTGLRPTDLCYKQCCPECQGRDHGAPWIESFSGRRFEVSVSHTAGLVAAVAGHAWIDVEAVASCAGPMAGALTNADEDEALRRPDPALARARCWTIKESLVKQGFLGLDDACRWSAGPLDGDLVRISCGAHTRCCAFLRTPPGYAGAISLSSPTPTDIEELNL